MTHIPSAAPVRRQALHGTSMSLRNRARHFQDRNRLPCAYIEDLTIHLVLRQCKHVCSNHVAHMDEIVCLQSVFVDKRSFSLRELEAENLDDAGIRIG